MISTIYKQANKEAPQGMILVTTLVIMLLITIMGALILFNSRVEIATTLNTRQSFNAFTYADAAAQLAIGATKVMAFYGDTDMVVDYLTAKATDDNFHIDIKSRFQNLAVGDDESNRYSIQERYFRAGNSADLEPDIILTDPKTNKILATVAISKDFGSESATMVGGGNEIASGGSTDGAGLRKLFYIITVTGRDPTMNLNNKSDFFSNDHQVTGPQSFITVLYSVVTN